MDPVTPVTPETPATPPMPAVTATPPGLAAPATAAPVTISLDGLDADLKGNKTVAGLAGKPVGEVLRMLVNAESLIGKKGVVLPQGPEDKAGLAAFRKAIGVPESPDKYPAPKLAEGVEPDEAVDGQLRQWGIDLGWTPEQYQGLVERLVAHNAAEAQTRANEMAQKLEEAKAAQMTAWGGKYAANVQLANNAAAAFADEKDLAELKELGLLEHPTFLRVMKNAGEAISPDRLHVNRQGQTDLAGIDSQVDQVMQSKAYMDPRDPGHEAATQRVAQLLNQKHNAR